MADYGADFFTMNEVNLPKVIHNIVDPRLTTHHVAKLLGISDSNVAACYRAIVHIVRWIWLTRGAGNIYKWEFRRGEDYRVIDVPGQICVSETALAIELALAGAGIAYCLEQRVNTHLRDGSLRVVLPDQSPTEIA